MRDRDKKRDRDRDRERIYSEKETVQTDEHTD